jgi:hypothetical protein
LKLSQRNDIARLQKKMSNALWIALLTFAEAEVEDFVIDGDEWRNEAINMAMAMDRKIELLLQEGT